MQATFTERLETLLKNKHYGEESEDSSLTEVLELMRQFPDFDFQSDAVHITFAMETLFMQDYDLREIGAETEELFIHHWREKTNELLVKYVPKIKMWIDNFNELFKFTVRLELQETKENSENESENTTENSTNSNLKQKEKTTRTTDTNTNKYYLNPASSTIENLKVQDVDKSDSENNITDNDTENNSETGSNTKAGQKAKTGEQERNMSRDVLQTVWGKTRAMILQQIFDLQSVYLECLYEFETIFMGLY